MIGTPRGILVVIVVMSALAAALPAGAEEWSGVSPGVSTMDTVKTRFGTRTRATTQQLEGKDTVQWIYEGAQAPAGIARLTVDFGLLTSAGYRPEIVRAFTLEPKPGAFNREVILRGWGLPSRTGRDGEREVLFYQEGLLVFFDPKGEVEILVFTPPQPLPDAPAGPRPP